MLPDSTAEMEITFDNALYKLFPDATKLEYWGAAIHLDENWNVVSVTCGGVTKHAPR